MKLLLDTHVAIWSLARIDLLKPEIRDLIANAENEIHVSAVSILEIGIKHAFGRRSAPPFGSDETLRLCTEANYTLIAITSLEAAAVSLLPPSMPIRSTGCWWHKHLMALYRLVTRDATVARYSDTIILAR